MLIIAVVTAGKRERGSVCASGRMRECRGGAGPARLVTRAVSLIRYMPGESFF